MVIYLRTMVKNSLFSELAWNISAFSRGFSDTACSFHFGVTVEFSCVCVRSTVIVELT